jgi:large subunit ribosomal protein LP0
LEIISPTKILVIGQKISMSEINLMKKFNIKPYRHFVQIRQIYLNGKVYGEEILKINDNYLRERVERGITNVAALSLRLGVSNKASAVHTISNCFRNLAGLGAATNCMFRQAEGLLASSAPAQAAPAKEEKKETKKKEEPKKEEPKQEAEDEPLGLFDF